MKNKKLSILWFLFGNQNVASSRLQGYLIHKELLRLRIDSHIIYSPKSEFTPDFPAFIEFPIFIDLTDTISIIQKLRGSNTNKLISWLRYCGSKIVYVNCDIESKNKSWTKADLVLATSDILCQYHRSFFLHHVQLINEPYEYYCHPFNKEHDKDRKPLICIVWFGYKENWDALLPWKRIIETEFSEIAELITCSNHPDSTVQWSNDAQRNLLLRADIGILPAKNTLEFSAKSPNRLIQCMAMSIPCITGSLNSYLSMKISGAPIYIAKSDEDFRFYLRKLLDNNRRAIMGLESYHFVVEKFSPKRVVNKWVEVLDINDQVGNNTFPELDIERLRKILSLLMTAGLCIKTFSKIIHKLCHRLYSNRGNTSPSALL